MSCAIFTVLSVAAALSTNGNKLTVTGTALIAIASFFWAAFKAWQEEYKARKAAEEALDDRNPKLVVVIGDCITRYDADQDKTLFFLMTTVINQGQDSVALGWSATFHLGGTSEEMEPRWIIGQYVLTVGQTEVTLTNADLIHARTRDRAIARGTIAEGRLMFVLEGNRLPLLQGKNYEIVVSCLDYNAKSYEGKYRPALAQMKELRYPHTEQVRRLTPPAG